MPQTGKYEKDDDIKTKYNENKRDKQSEDICHLSPIDPMRPYQGLHAVHLVEEGDLQSKSFHNLTTASINNAVFGQEAVPLLDVLRAQRVSSRNTLRASEIFCLSTLDGKPEVDVHF